MARFTYVPISRLFGIYHASKLVALFQVHLKTKKIIPDHYNSPTDNRGSWQASTCNFARLRVERLFYLESLLTARAFISPDTTRKASHARCDRIVLCYYVYLFTRRIMCKIHSMRRNFFIGTVRNRLPKPVAALDDFTGCVYRPCRVKA